MSRAGIVAGSVGNAIDTVRSEFPAWIRAELVDAAAY